MQVLNQKNIIVETETKDIASKISNIIEVEISQKN